MSEEHLRLGCLHHVGVMKRSATVRKPELASRDVVYFAKPYPFCISSPLYEDASTADRQYTINLFSEVPPRNLCIEVQGRSLSPRTSSLRTRSTLFSEVPPRNLCIGLFSLNRNRLDSCQSCMLFSLNIPCTQFTDSHPQTVR